MVRHPYSYSELSGMRVGDPEGAVLLYSARYWAAKAKDRERQLKDLRKEYRRVGAHNANLSSSRATLVRRLEALHTDAADEVFCQGWYEGKYACIEEASQ